MKKLYGAIEAGGTKFVCAVGSGPDDLQTVRFATTTPQQTLQQTIDFFMPYQRHLKAIGVGSFGPVDLDFHSATYGHITSTPKPGWANTDMIGALRHHFEIPMGFDTDVNGAALGEGRWGAAQGLENYIYITIGTGIGGGVVANGELVHGLVHPELGHILLTKLADDTFAGSCPFHGDACFEGLASGPAIEARWQMPGSDLPADHEGWDMQARYIAQALMTYMCALSPQRIILGGGVMAQAQLLPLIQTQLLRCLNGYIQHPAILDGMDKLVVLPGLGDKAGILGALVLAQQAEALA